MNTWIQPLLISLFLALAACVPDGAEVAENNDQGSPTTGNSTDQKPDDNNAGNNDTGGETTHPTTPPTNGMTTEPEEPDTPVEVEVSHSRELRGAWIPTVWNISWPSRTGLSQSAQKSELTALMETAKSAGLNAVFFQIRGEADAYYASNYEPWSRFLSGRMGQDPGYDPLEFAIIEAHKRGLELHVWMNPYRALASGDASLASSGHIVKSQPGIVVRYGNLHWMDPGRAEVRTHTLNVVRDVLTRYDVDGLHFDDYFYPYPDGSAFPDSGTYNAYKNAGGTLSLGDFRRNNVHLLVEAVHKVVEEERPDIRFGISPFGIYRPGTPPGISGLDQYDAIYADPLRWIDEGWVDYIAPQLYWPTTQTAQAFGTLLNWWADQANRTGVDLFVGQYTSQLGSSSAWTVSELLEQIRLTRAARDRRALGNIHYHINPVDVNKSGLKTALTQIYSAPAAPPPIPRADGRPAAPQLDVADDGITFDNDGELRYIAVYSDGNLLRLVPAATGRFGLPVGEYDISLIDRYDRESLAVPVTVTVDSDDGGTPVTPTGRSCTHTNGGTYSHLACSPSYQCCDGEWRQGTNVCGTCACTESTGQVGCSP